MEVGLVKRVDIDQEMQQSYLDYAMSVIVARALPDARDGLKPVQRRILYAMQDLNLAPDTAYKKSARVVGEVLGKYHPHGDVAVYEAMARLAQDFSLRYPLVDGQGNFGSIDGDPPAAMRYTEARLTRFATELMAQIERNTVDFVDNFDGTLREPEVLPAMVPNLLVNGASGIAVGMATSIPPHNLVEVIDALLFLIEKWDHLDDLGVSDLMRFVKGPDFPTGGLILQEGGDTGILSAYGSGKGRITVRGRVHAEELGRGRSRLIITELPYQTNKTTLIERIAELVREGDFDGISDLRDESDRQGMRIVIELKQGVEIDHILRMLYQRTPLQTTFGINLLALVDGEPRLLNLKQALRVFLEHRLTVVRRRSEFDLAKAKQRAHILEGLRVALKNLDEIISLIKSSPDAEQARTRLMKRYNLTEVQAQAILDMQLRRLASLERKKIEDEYKEVMALVKELQSLLQSSKKMRQVVGEELISMKQNYGDRRRTQIVSLQEGTSAKTLLTTTDVTPSQEVWVGVTRDGKIGRTVGETRLKVEPRYLLKTSTHDTLCLVNAQGQASAIAVHALPEIENFDEGAPLYKASALSMEDKVAAMFALRDKNGDDSEKYIFTVTRQGMVKKSVVSELPGPSAQRFVLVKVNADDELVDVALTDGKAEIGLVTAQGMGIRFSEEEVRPMGLVAAGVMGIKLGEGDAVAALLTWDVKSELVIAASDGAAWRISGADFPLQGRYGQGVIACRVGRTAEIVGAIFGGRGSVGMLHYQKGSTRTFKFADVSLVKRVGKATQLVTIKAGDEVGGLSLSNLGGAAGKEKTAPESRKSPATSKPEEKTLPKKTAAAGAGAEKGDAKAQKHASPTMPASEAGSKKKSQVGASPAEKRTARAASPVKPGQGKPTSGVEKKKQPRMTEVAGGKKPAAASGSPIVSEQTTPSLKGGGRSSQKKGAASPARPPASKPISEKAAPGPEGPPAVIPFIDEKKKKKAPHLPEQELLPGLGDLKPKTNPRSPKGLSEK